MINYLSLFVLLKAFSSKVKQQNRLKKLNNEIKYENIKHHRPINTEDPENKRIHHPKKYHLRLILLPKN